MYVIIIIIVIIIVIIIIVTIIMLKGLSRFGGPRKITVSKSGIRKCILSQA